MQIPFGRRRLIVTVALTPAPPRLWEEAVAVGLGDHDLARLSRGAGIDRGALQLAGAGTSL